MRSLRALLVRDNVDLVLLFVLAFAVLGYVQRSPVIGDPDGFYHAKMALFLSRGQVLTALPWMYFSTLRDAFTDHHFLYHLLLVPLVIFGKPLLGVKLATVFFSASFFTTFYWFLRRHKATWPLFFTLLLLTTSSFIFRLSLIKANSVSLIVFLLILTALTERRVLLLFFLNGIYVWLYGGWFLSWVAAAAFLVVSMLYRVWYREDADASRDVLDPKRHKRYWFRMSLATIGGTAAGLFFNPYWPQNLAFYWQQVWQIAIVNVGGRVNVGGEWSSLSPLEFAGFYGFVPIFFCTAIVLVFTNASRVRERTWLSLALTGLFLLFTIKSRRYIELSAPMTVLSSAFVYSDIFPKDALRDIWNAWRPSFPRLRENVRLFFSLGIAIFVFLPKLGPVAQITSVRAEIAGGVPLTKYRSALTWLEEHSEPESIVVHSDWDDWPMLFYFNDHNRYIIGLDPTFMHNYDADLHDRWAALTARGESDDLLSFMKDELGTRYALIEKDHGAMESTFAQNVYFELVYEDSEAWVYALKE